MRRALGSFSLHGYKDIDLKYNLLLKNIYG